MFQIILDPAPQLPSWPWPQAHPLTAHSKISMQASASSPGSSLVEALSATIDPDIAGRGWNGVESKEEVPDPIAGTVEFGNLWGAATASSCYVQLLQLREPLLWGDSPPVNVGLFDAVRPQP